MATCDLDDGSKAPENFHISSSIENDDSHWLGCTMKCPLCIFSRKSFHCKECVREGNFLHSTDVLTERFAEKQLRYREIKSIHETLNKRCEQLLQKHKVVENLKYDIKQKRENIALIRRLLVERANTVKKENAHKDQLLKNIKDTKKKFPQYENNVKILKDYVDQRFEANAKMSESRNKLQQELKYRVRHNIQALVKYIFPIAEVKSNPEIIDFKRDKNDTVSELAEATQTAYVSGHWVFQKGPKEFQHVIVAPSLPADGDYTAYNDWVITNKDGVPSSNTNTMEALSSSNHAYRISAALTYTAQLVDLLSFYLDVRLPHKLSYGDFCKKELNKASFSRKVHRLNLNILFLCIMQNVSPRSLSLVCTLANILNMLNTDITDLGRIGPVNVLSRSAQDFINHNDMHIDLAGDDSETDDENSFPTEWEAIPHLSPLDSIAAPQPVQSVNQQQTVSIAGGLMNNAVNSVTSIWRGFTGR